MRSDTLWMHLKAQASRSRSTTKKCDGIHREAKADHMCKHVRQFEFRRVHTDPYKALSKLGEAANNATD